MKITSTILGTALLAVGGFIVYGLSKLESNDDKLGRVQATNLEGYRSKRSEREKLTDSFNSRSSNKPNTPIKDGRNSNGKSKGGWLQRFYSKACYYGEIINGLAKIVMQFCNVVVGASRLMLEHEEGNVSMVNSNQRLGDPNYGYGYKRKNQRNYQDNANGNNNGSYNGKKSKNNYKKNRPVTERVESRPMTEHEALNVPFEPFRVPDFKMDKEREEALLSAALQPVDNKGVTDPFGFNAAGFNTSTF
jgi:hypothetical protein